MTASSEQQDSEVLDAIVDVVVNDELGASDDLANQFFVHVGHIILDVLLVVLVVGLLVVGAVVSV